jgi:hypothetical protein
MRGMAQSSRDRKPTALILMVIAALLLAIAFRSDNGSVSAGIHFACFVVASALVASGIATFKNASAIGWAIVGALLGLVGIAVYFLTVVLAFRVLF